LPEAVARALGDRVRLRTRVEEIAVGDDSVRVALEGGEEVRARTAVLATPAHVTRTIARDLPDETRGALAEIVYGSYVVAAVLTSETEAMPWDGIYAVATAKRSFNMLFNMANVVRGGAREPGGSLMVYSGGRLAQRLWDADDAQVRTTYLDDLDAVFPGAGDLVAETHVHRWEHGLPYVRPGRERLQRTLEQPLGRLALAGDYLGARYTDTAIATGAAAAASVRAQL
jgi:oxygen-dependent protoporphyrinogen oxidase